eukprot:6213062-Pleurochrysis_carterae.AAC.3
MKQSTLDVSCSAITGSLLFRREETTTLWEKEYRRKLSSVRERRRTAECWGGEEYSIEWDDGEQRWVNKREVENMNGAEADCLYQARELAT